MIITREEEYYSMFFIQSLISAVNRAKNSALTIGMLPVSVPISVTTMIKRKGLKIRIRK